MPFWTLRSKAGSHWLDPILLAPLQGQKGDIVFCGDRCEISPGAECKKRGASSQLKKLSVSLCNLRLENGGRTSEETLGISWQSVSRTGLRGLSLLPGLYSRHEHSAILWSCPIHDLMGFTPHIYTTPVLLTEEIFPLLKKKHIPVKSKPELSLATKANFKVSLKLTDRYGCLTQSKKLGTTWVLGFAMA